MQPVDVARTLVGRRFPDCRAAFLAGSVVRGEGTATSDLDILVIVPDHQPSFRESLRFMGWPVEIFVQTLAGHRDFAARDAARRRPSTSHIVCEALVLADRDGLAGQLKDEACALLKAGPPLPGPAELAWARYALTDLLDDLAGATDPADMTFIACELAVAAADLILDCNRCWRGRGKWLLRALRNCDPWLAERLAGAMEALLRDGDREPLVAFADDALAPVGGRLWEGFRVGNPGGDGE